jgi:hypothetical protein
MFTVLIGEYGKIFEKITMGISNIIGSTIKMEEL